MVCRPCLVVQRCIVVRRGAVVRRRIAVGSGIVVRKETPSASEMKPGFNLAKPVFCGLMTCLFHSIRKKSSLCQIRRRCALTQATSLLRSLRPVCPEFRCNTLKHPVLPVLPGNTLYLLTRRRVVLTPCLHLSSGSLHFLLMMAPASHCLFRAPDIFLLLSVTSACALVQNLTCIG